MWHRLCVLWIIWKVRRVCRDTLNISEAVLSGYSYHKNEKQHCNDLAGGWSLSPPYESLQRHMNRTHPCLGALRTCRDGLTEAGSWEPEPVLPAACGSSVPWVIRAAWQCLHGHRAGVGSRLEIKPSHSAGVPTFASVDVKSMDLVTKEGLLSERTSCCHFSEGN